MPNLRIHHQISEINAEQWDRLRGDDYPFLKHAFLNALEQSGCVCEDSGWHPVHLVVEQQGELIAAMPMYLKATLGENMFSTGHGKRLGSMLDLSIFPSWSPRFLLPRQRAHVFFTTHSI
ncbi:peptidogalycan biosysnthesis protein [Vibrio olivae]